MDTRFNTKQAIIAWLAVFVFMTIVALIPLKLEIAPWVGAPGQASQWDEMTKRIFIYLSRLITAALLVYIYTKTSEGKSGLAHGLRYGFGISLIMYVPWMFALAVSDWPASAVITRTIVGIIEATIAGAIVAQIYKPPKAAAA